MKSAFQEYLNNASNAAVDSNIPWQEMPLGILVASVFDNLFNLPEDAIAELEGTELGRVIAQHNAGEFKYVSIETYRQWKNVFNDRYLYEGSDLKRLLKRTLVFEVDGQIAWDFYLEMLCNQLSLPPLCWVCVKKPSGGREAIEVIDSKPQYKTEAPQLEVIETMTTAFLSISQPNNQ